MGFEPQKLFVGLMDFFTILLPGALLTFMLKEKAGPLILGDRASELVGTGAWAAFLFVSYLLGHLSFLLGSWLDEFYDWVRGYTLNAQITLLARRDRLLPWIARVAIWLVFKGERNLALHQAIRIKEHRLRSSGAANSINAFQWCKAFLNVGCQPSLTVVQRLEADSKFFRTFFVVLVLLSIFWGLNQNWSIPGFIFVLLLLLLALWRYMEQRSKAINQTYWSVITLTAPDAEVRSDDATPKEGSPTHAGGVVFRSHEDKIEYLLVEAKDDPDQWVLPKGHIEEREDYRETAVREVREETGIWAAIGVVDFPHKRTLTIMEEGERKRRRTAADLGNKRYSVNGKSLTVRYFLMQAVGRGRQEDKGRRHVWLPLKEAVERATNREAQELLRIGEDRRTSLAAVVLATGRREV